MNSFIEHAQPGPVELVLAICCRYALDCFAVRRSSRISGSRHAVELFVERATYLNCSADPRPHHQIPGTFRMYLVSHYPPNSFVHSLTYHVHNFAHVVCSSTYAVRTAPDVVRTAPDAVHTAPDPVHTAPDPVHTAPNTTGGTATAAFALCGKHALPKFFVPEFGRTKLMTIWAQCFRAFGRQFERQGTT
ncbi:hypothetical protein FIBSPDRAFT_965200 [Athelia psychrophila]|uniref:Uncharacterized protein n=1 Tax=Athelia psychrophila TaxID=1759441 RepID=A0A165WXE3_9AGAM|nr:hypothetical protein FIBSPDRAFT_965200 [Fibularhizoctonia sp. CBS 109695]